MRITCAGKTDVGRKRQLNEDSFYTSEEHSFCVLADGMVISLSLLGFVLPYERRIRREKRARRIAAVG